MPELKTRIQLKYDTLTNWNASTFSLKAGEVAIATTGETVSENLKGTNKPVLMKVGPGVFKDLPWLSALAADVYDWAKQSPEDFATYVKGLIKVTDIDAYSKKEVDDLLSANSAADQKYADDLIAGLDVTDTAVTGKYVSAVSEVDGKIEVSRADLPTYTLASGSANGTVAFNGTDVAITGLKSAAYVETTAFDAAGSAAAVLGTASDEATANTVYGAKAAAAKAQSDIDAFFAAADKGDAALDTLKEIQDFLNSDSGTVQTLVDDVAGNKEAIADIVDGTTAVAKATNADTAAEASGLNEAGVAAVKAVKVDNATNADKAANADKLGDAVAADYLKKADAPGYADILTKTAAATGYQPKGEYATAAQGTKADSALQEITTTANSGLKVTNKNKIDIDDSVVFVFDCGSATVNID